MKTIRIWNDNPSENQVREIVDLIREGRVAIIPTDSTYAIVCDALNQKAINELCRIKGLNPDKNNLSIICSDISMAAEYAHIDDKCFNILRRNTPGAFTFLFKASRSLPKAFKGRKIVGIRIPDCNTACAVAKELGNPILTTSIEFEDEDNAREPELIADNYEHKGVELMVDNDEGDTQFTTIVDFTSGADACEIVREGKATLN